ncbi:unnamed protein product [Jaminaea pallidilutea]
MHMLGLGLASCPEIQCRKVCAQPQRQKSVTRSMHKGSTLFASPQPFNIRVRHTTRFEIERHMDQNYEVTRSPREE